MTTSLRSELNPLLAPLAERVRLATDHDYGAACAGFNLAYAKEPDLVVMATSAADVAAAVKYAAAGGLKVCVQATGHGSSPAAKGGLLINTSLMQNVSVDPALRSARVGAGVLWRDVIEAAAPFGLAPLCGSSPTVSVVGLTLGGGMGPVGRTFGFAADRVTAAQIVTADGKILEVNEEVEPELFWALRGGKCSVGIITELEFGLMELSDYYGGAIYYPAQSAAAVLNAFQAWAPTLPEEVSTSVALLRLPDMEGVPPPLRGNFCVSLRYVHVGSDERGAELLEPMRAAGEPLMDLVRRTPYSAIASVHQDPEDPMPAWDRSLLLKELPPAAISALLEVAGPQVELPLIMVELRLMGGALSRPQGTPNAVGGRDAAFSLGVIGAFPPPLRGAVTAAGSAVMSAVEPWSTGGTQINFQGDAATYEEVQRAWPKETWARLRELKQRLDPDERFSFGYPV